MDSKTPEQICLDAAELISTYGHMKNTIGNYDVGFCALGAIMQAFDQTRSAWSNVCTPEVGQAWGLLSKTLGFSTDVDIPKWNNADERTAEDVILALKRAGHGE